MHLNVCGHIPLLYGNEYSRSLHPEDTKISGFPITYIVFYVITQASTSTHPGVGNWINLLSCCVRSDIRHESYILGTVSLWHQVWYGSVRLTTYIIQSIICIIQWWQICIKMLPKMQSDHHTCIRSDMIQTW